MVDYTYIPNASGLIQELVRTDDAVTILKRVALTPRIEDARFVASSPKALALYSAASHHQLAETWRSFSEQRQSLRAALIVSFARSQGHPVPESYITDINQFNGRILPIVKTVRQIGLDGTDAWVSHLMPANQHPDHTRLHHVMEIARALPYRFQKDPFGGMIFLAEVNDHVSSIIPVRSFSYGSPASMLHYNEHVKYEMATTEIALNAPNPDIAERPVQTKYLHKCAVCSGHWIGDKRDPPHCAYCNTRMWRTGERKNRNTQERS